MTDNNQKIITRFAPSPTGRFHVGGVRSALYNYLFARQNNGQYILRIDDTDKERSKKEYEDEIFEVFKWLNLEHDKTFKQSDRIDIYEKYIKKMIDDGFAYISKEEPKEEGDRSEVIRFKNPNKKVSFNDLILGKIEISTDDLGDFVIAKSLTEPVYHTASVIDDYESGVTHVIRGQEHSVNTIRQILIGEAIGAKMPQYAHLPLILNQERAKLSKRDPLVVPAIEYKSLGYLPEALLNFMALNGWNPGTEEEIFTLKDLLEKFSLDRVQKSAGVFNPEKLDWINREHIKMMSEQERNSMIRKFLDDTEISKETKFQDEFFMKKIYPIIFDRISKFGDIKNMIGEGELSYFFQDPNISLSSLCWKDETKDEAKKHLEWILNKLKSIEESVFSNPENIKSIIFDYATDNGRGQVLWPLRVSLSGKEKSPDPFTLIFILGKEKAIERIEKAISVLD